MSKRISNKKIKRVIESATGGKWVNDASSRKDKPALWFMDVPVEVMIYLHDKYHSKVSLQNQIGE